MSASTDPSDVTSLTAAIQQLVTQLLTGIDLFTATDTINNAIEAASISQATQMLEISASASTAADAAKVTADASKASYLKAAAPSNMYLHPGAHGANKIINYGLTIGSKLYNASVTPLLQTQWDH